MPRSSASSHNNLVLLQHEFNDIYHGMDLQQVASGENKEALREVYDKLTAILEATAMMLKGADKERRIERVDNGCDSGVNSDNDTETDGPARRTTSRNTVTSQDRPATVTAGDLDAASNISGLSQRDKERSELESEESGAIKMLLFTSQIQKISNIISMLTHKRSLVRRLLDHSNEWEGLKNPTDSFDWQCHVRYRWDEEQQACKVEIFDMVFDYGFEYQGTSSRLVLSPLTDKCFLGLAQAVKNKMVGVCTGEFVSAVNICCILGTDE